MWSAADRRNRDGREGAAGRPRNPDSVFQVEFDPLLGLQRSVRVHGVLELSNKRRPGRGGCLSPVVHAVHGGWAETAAACQAADDGGLNMARQDLERVGVLLGNGAGDC